MASVSVGLKSRCALSKEQKKQICLFKESHQNLTQSEIKDHFSKKWGIAIGRSIISEIIKAKDMCLLVKTDSKVSELKVKDCKEPELEKALFIWFTEMRKKAS